MTINSQLKSLIAINLPGRYPVTSARGHSTSSSCIIVIPITSTRSQSRTESCELVRVFTECYDSLKKNGLTARLLHLDNEVSHNLIATIEKQRLGYQLASSGDHRLNEAERAIQTFKAHFIAIRSGANRAFPKNCWSLLLDEAVLTLNLLRLSRINTAIFAYTHIHGVFDFNKTPLAPAGCKVIVHDRIDH